MILELTNSLLFLLYEFSIFMACMSIFYKIGKNENITKTKLIVLVISTNIVISSLISTIFSFLQINNSVYYVLTALFLAISLNSFIIKNDHKQYKEFLSSFVNYVFENLFSKKNLVFFSLLLPLLFNIIKPPENIDSLDVMNSILPMAFNQINPYDFYYNYVAFWELSYFPSLIITNSDNFFWYDSIKPVILIGLGSYLVGRTLGLPKFLVALVAFSGILFFHFWMPAGPSGISTLKNDMIFGAGVIFLAYYLIKAKTCPSFSNFIIFLLGSVFVLNKFSGVPIIVFSIVLLIIINKNKLLEKIRHPYVWFYVIVIFITTGHYYLKNLILFENPFYPIKFVVGGVGFQNGLYDLSGTSIISSLGNPKLWEYLSPSDLLKADLFLPIYLGIVIIFSFLIYSIIKHPKKNLEKYHFLVGLFILGTWALFLNSGWSASAIPEDFAYISTLNSLRYVEGLVVLTEIFLVFLSWRIGISVKILIALVAVHVALQLFGLYSQLPYGIFANNINFDFTLLVFPFIFVLVLFVIKNRISHLRGKITILLFVIAMIFIFSPHLLESNRAYWILPFNDVIFEIYDSKSSNIVLIPEPSFRWYFTYVYPLSGNNFQHDVITLTEKQFKDGNGKPYFKQSDSHEKPDYIIRLCDPLHYCNKDLNEFATRMIDYNYSLKKIANHGLVLQLNQ